MSSEAETTADDLRIGRLTDDQLLAEYRLADADEALVSTLAAELTRRGLRL